MIISLWQDKNANEFSNVSTLTTVNKTVYVSYVCDTYYKQTKQNTNLRKCITHLARQPSYENIQKYTTKSSEGGNYMTTKLCLRQL
jgi:hypothetical protein